MSSLTYKAIVEIGKSQSYFVLIFIKHHSATDVV